MPFRRLSVLLAAGFVVSAQAEGSLQRTLKAFEDKPGYVQPLATWFGTFTNQDWFQSARVGDGFGWDFSLPIGIGFLDSDDHTYTSTFDSNCDKLRAQGYNLPADKCPSSYTVPTIVGPATNVHYYRYDIDPTDASGQGVVLTDGGYADDGDENLRKISTLGMTWAQLGFSYRHARVAMRFMALPEISELSTYRHLGFGLQYSLGHFFAHKLPPAHPVDVSLATTYNFIKVGYSPKDYTGELVMDIFTQWHALVVGTRFGQHVELFTELGYETSNIESSGHLVPKVEGNDEISPRVSVDGRNGFKASINIALHFGNYQPVLGISRGAQTGVNAGILNFGKEGTP